MKNLLTKIRNIAVLALASLFVAMPAVHAGGGPEFNTNARENDFLTGRNVTENGTWSDPVNASAGEDVDVAVYYHNNVPNTTATNVRIKLTMPSATELATTHVIKGQLSADNALTVDGSYHNGQEIGRHDFTIDSSAATKVAYVPGSLRWYPNANSQGTSGNGATLPNGQNGDSIVTNGITIGNLEGCFDFAGFVIVRVHLTGEVHVPILTLKKEVRKAGTSDAFQGENRVNPGTQVEYRLTVNNLDGAGVANNVRLHDVLPNGVTFVPGSAVLHTSNGQSTAVSDNIITANGVVVLAQLQPLDSFTITFLANTATTFKNDDCAINQATVSADSPANTTQATAKTCFIVVTPTPTPTPPTPTPPIPTPTPIVPTPKPTLPETGPASDLIMTLGLSGFGATASRFYFSKKKLKKNLSNIDIA